MSVKKLRAVGRSVFARRVSFFSRAGCVLACVMQLHAAPVFADAVLNAHVTVISATCDIHLTPERLYMPAVIPADFTANSGTAATRDVDVRVDNCTPGGQNPGISVTGTALDGGTTIFSDTPTGDAGFMLTSSAYKGALSGFRASPDVVTSGVVNSMADFTGSTDLTYSVGFVSKDISTPPVYQTATASLTFSFSYR